MDAELSEATTGLKSFLLKLVDPLFKKKGTGAVVPIKIAGAADKPSFGVDLGRVLTREEVAAPVPATDGFSRSIRSCSAVFRQPPDDPGRITSSSQEALGPTARRP